MRFLFVGGMILAILCLLGLASWLFLWPLWVEYRATPANHVQPDRLPLGVVRVGAMVEADLRVRIDPKQITGLVPRVREPYFVKLQRTALSTHEEANERGAYCDIFFSIDTSRPGHHSGNIKVLLGDYRAEVPVTITVVPRESDVPRVLIVSAPFDRFSTDDGSHFEPFIEAIRPLKIDVNYTRHLPAHVSEFDIILLAEEELCSLDDRKLGLLPGFVDGGGRLIVAANSFFVPSVPSANRILEGFGLEIEDSENTSLVESLTITSDALTESVTRLSFHRPSPVRVTDAKKATILVGSPFDANAGFVAVSRGNGEVVVLTQSLWWIWLGRDAHGSDNPRLFQNLLSRPPKSSGSRP